MLTAEWVRVRRTGDELALVALARPARARALAMAEELVALARSSAGCSRKDVLDAFEAVPASARERKIKGGLIKLLSDRLTFGTESAVDPVTLREVLFTRASSRRAERPEGGAWDRDAVIEEVAGELGISSSVLETSLYADLRTSQQLSSFEPISPEALVSSYETGQVQAVLQRATRLTVDVRHASPSAARAVLHRVKFLQLLFSAQPIDGGYRLVIDGPMSLFESGTRYGRKIAQLVPLLEACEDWDLVAKIEWTRGGSPLTFRAQSSGTARPVEVSYAPHVSALVEGFARLKTEWQVRPCTALLTLPGVGLSVPDLEFERAGVRVYFEVLGYWSREAVFRRIDLAQKGLPQKVIFAVDDKLRVSEEAMGEVSSAALYVYRGTMSARALTERLERISASNGA